MKRKTASQAKNAIRRALADLIDPPPSAAKQALLRKHFENRCAYCGDPAPPRDGHIDHARPEGGSGLANLLLACRVCNGDEKREMNWEEFLARKCAGKAEALAERRERILAWFREAPTAAAPTAELIALRDAAVAEVCAAFDTAFRRVSDAARRAGEPTTRNE